MLCHAFAGLDLVRLVTYDAGACSKANARAVRDRDLHYLFGDLAGTVAPFRGMGQDGSHA